MDESFDDGPFTQGNGTPNGVPSAELDDYSANPLTNTVTSSPLTATGSVATNKFFLAGKSYKLTPGQVLSVGENYQDPANGDTQVVQFAVNVDPIPPAGTVGEFRWNLDMDNSNPQPDNSFYVRLVSTGSVVNIIGGEDLGTTTSSTIGTLTTVDSWAYITLLCNKNSSAVTYNSPVFAGQGAISQGVHFFNSSNTQALAIGLAGGSPATFRARDWSFTATGGTIYLDDVYWEGGLDNAGWEQFSRARPLYVTKTVSNSAENWQYLE